MNTHINSNANICKRDERVLRLNTYHDGRSLCVKMLGQFSSFWSQLISGGHTEKFGRHLSRTIDFVHVIIQTSAVTHYAFSNTQLRAHTCTRMNTHIQTRDSIKHFFKQVWHLSQYQVAKVVHGNPSDNHCNWSDAWPFTLWLQLYYQPSCSLPCLVHAHTHTLNDIYTLTECAN